MTTIRFRQIHMDFHTSEAIVGIGAAFDPDQFADTLAEAAVNSVTCFARGHHGWVYFDSQVFPERKHPHLERNLLADGLAGIEELQVDFPAVQTNMVFIRVDKPADQLPAFLRQRGILIRGGESIRLVTHLDVSEKDIRIVIASFKEFFSA